MEKMAMTSQHIELLNLNYRTTEWLNNRPTVLLNYLTTELQNYRINYVIELFNWGTEE